MHETLQMIESWLGRALQSDRHICLALRHGARIIGASVLSLDPESDNHLSPGPCISMEYRNRGFGSRLLEHSFNALGQAGLARAFALTRGNTSVARFLISRSFTAFPRRSTTRRFSPPEASRSCLPDILAERRH